MSLSTLKGVYPYNGLDEFMELTPVRVYMSGKKNAGKYALVSAGDLGKVIGYRWYIWGPYVSSNDLESTLHAIIIGERPSEVPADWVIDHSDRNPLNNVRTNLLFVPRQYNQWNTEPTGESKYKGVYIPFSRENGTHPDTIPFVYSTISRHPSLTRWLPSLLPSPSTT
jgi:hypothetical protein